MAVALTWHLADVRNLGKFVECLTRRAIGQYLLVRGVPFHEVSPRYVTARVQYPASRRADGPLHPLGCRQGGHGQRTNAFAEGGVCQDRYRAFNGHGTSARSGLGWLAERAKQLRMAGGPESGLGPANAARA
jgi:hypothetical protein